MKKSLLLLLLFLSAAAMRVYGQDRFYTISGVVCDRSTKEPLEMAVVYMPEYGLWASTNEKGEFAIQKVPQGRSEIRAGYLGYKGESFLINVSRNIDNFTFKLQQSNLSLGEVTITANEVKRAVTTTRTIEKQAIEHLQMVSVSDILALLPGGVTQKQDLTRESRINLRGDISGGFGTAVVMDGINLSSNSSMMIDEVSYMPLGADVRAIGATNVESVEVITGVPSVEYGDMTAGLVLINTKRGRSPLNVQVSINPKTKQVAVSKGFNIGKKGGVININGEYARAFRNPVSRYITYFRNNYGINYSQTFNEGERPVRFNLTLNGGFARHQEKNDPDAYNGTWLKDNSVNIRVGTDLRWLINGRWITNLEFHGSLSYAGLHTKERKYFSNPTIQPSVNSTEDGYYETNYLPAQFYNGYNRESDGLDFKVGVKATLNKKIGSVKNNLKVGFDWSNSGNVGRGIYYDDNLMPDGFRERGYDQTPFLNNYAGYIEDNATIPLGKRNLSLVAGVRLESLSLRGISYNGQLSCSPRFNGKYTLVERKRRGFLRELSLKGAWGLMGKLPSLGFIYPYTQYKDILVYNKTYGADNKVFSVAKTFTYKPQIESGFKLAQNRNIEAGIEANLGGVHFSLIYFNNKSKNAYRQKQIYLPYSYVKSDERFPIPSNPQFRVDKRSGAIFVKDLDNPTSGEILIPTYVSDTTFIAMPQIGNYHDVTTQGVELNVNFGQIKAIRTSFILDASYLHSKDIDETLNPIYPNGPHSLLPAGEGRSYEFVGYYLGGTSRTQTYNGTAENTFNANLTIVTHIPQIRLTLSARVEAALYNSKEYITYYNGKEWAYLVDEKGNRVEGSVYNQKEYATGVWPVAYSTFDGVVKPFTAKEASDPRFASLIGGQNQTYRYIKDGYDPYFIANVSVTKEIGKIASISLYINNFTNTIPMVKYWASGLYQASKKISFTYGATLRLNL